jgi:hypothetical protein
VPAPGAFTVTFTLIVTAWFTTEGFGVLLVIRVVVSALFTASDALPLLPECTGSAGYVPVMVCGLLATFAGVTVEVQLDAVLVLGLSTQAGPNASVASDELRPTVPSGLNDGLYSSASDAGGPPLVIPITSTCPLFSSVAAAPLSACCSEPVASNLSLSGS